MGWRLVVTLLAFGTLVVGQIQDNNDLFPLGTLSQYATARDMNGTVAALYLMADMPGGTEQVRVPMDQDWIGVGRSEVEGQIFRIIDNPSLLQALANAHAELRPNDAQPVALYLMRSTIHLRDGREYGEREIETLVEWQVQPVARRSWRVRTATRVRRAYARRSRTAAAP